MDLVLPIAVNLVLGLVLWAVLVWRRKPDTTRLRDADEALALFRGHAPDVDGRATVSSDGRAALIEVAPAGLGLLLRQGRRWNARMLVAAEMASVRETADGALEIRFADFGWPRARLRFDDRELRAGWAARLGGLVLQRTERTHEDLRHA